MDFTLSKQQQMVQKMYREFAENEVKPLAKKVDAEEYFPKETVEKMGKLGMMGIYFPTSVGGAGGDVLSYVMAVEELSKVCGTTGVIVSAHTSLCAAPIYENGTPEQKEKYLPKLCSGEWLGAFGLTEPGAGTDAQGQQTTAVEDGDYWVLNGSKIFITNAGYADVFIVIAVTDKVLDKKGRPTKLCSAFIVERTDPGSLFQIGNGQILRAQLLERPADLYGAVSIGVRLHNAEESRPFSNVLTQRLVVMLQIVQRDISPCSFEYFHCLSLPFVN